MKGKWVIFHLAFESAFIWEPQDIHLEVWWWQVEVSVHEWMDECFIKGTYWKLWINSLLNLSDWHFSKTELSVCDLLGIIKVEIDLQRAGDFIRP